MSFQCVKKYEDSYDKYVLAATSEKVVLPDYLDKESKKLAETVIKKIFINVFNKWDSLF